MKILTESDSDEDFIEISLSDEEIKRLRDGKYVMGESEYGFDRKIIGICIKKKQYDEED